MRNICFSFLIFLFLLQGKAQSHPIVVEPKKTSSDSLSTDTAGSKRSFLLEFDFGSNRGYQVKRKTAGADTSLATHKYIVTSINYEANSGFYTSFGLYNAPGEKKKWDGLYYGLGWDFTISEKAEVYASLGYTRYVYNQPNNKSNVRPTSNDFDGYIKHDFGVVQLKVAGDYYFGGTNNDVDLIGYVDHAFYIDDILSEKDELSIDPMFTVVGATLNYYFGSVRIPANLPKKAKDKIQAALDDFSRFRITNYDFSLPLNYQVGKFDAEVAWHYNIQANLPDILNPKDFSYFTAMVSFDFLKK
jgi:hypothetical protein